MRKRKTEKEFYSKEEQRAMSQYARSWRWLLILAGVQLGFIFGMVISAYFLERVTVTALLQTGPIFAVLVWISLIDAVAVVLTYRAAAKRMPGDRLSVGFLTAIVAMPALYILWRFNSWFGLVSLSGMTGAMTLPLPFPLQLIGGVAMVMAMLSAVGVALSARRIFLLKNAIHEADARAEERKRQWRDENRKAKERQEREAKTAKALAELLLKEYYAGKFSSGRNTESEKAVSDTFDFFAGCTTEEEAKARYRNLSKTYHPDMLGGNEKIIKMVNKQYEEIKCRFGGG